VGDARLALGQRLEPLGVGEVDRVGDDRQPVGLAEKADLTWCVAGEVVDAKASHLVALGDGAGDLHPAAVPAAVKHRVDAPRPADRDLRHVPVVGPLVTLGVGHLVGVAEDRQVQEGSGAAVVGVAVAEHDPLDSAQSLAHRLDGLDHRLGSRVELHHPAVLLEKVDVHPPLDVTAQQPDAVSHLPERGAEGTAGKDLLFLHPVGQSTSAPAL
jgi:hypothetical protein